MARRKNVLLGATNEIAALEPQGMEISEGIRLFMQECRMRNLSEQTMKYYALQLRVMGEYIVEGTGSTDLAQITKHDIREHVILRMMDAGLKETSINSRLRAMRAFFNYLERELFINVNPMHGITLVKEKKNVIETFSAEQIRMMLRAPDMGTFTGQRDYTMMMLFLETGVRLKELVGIKTHHVDLKEGFIRVTEGKGYKERIVPIQGTMKRQLAKYLEIRGDVANEYVFLNIDNGQIAKRQVQSRLKAYGEAAGIKNVRVSPHTFRHTFAKMAVQNGANVFELQLMLGHTSLDMVRRYVNLYSQDIAKGHAKFSPLEKLHA